MFPTTRNHRFIHKETSERFVHSIERFFISQVTSDHKSHPSARLARVYHQIKNLKIFESLQIIWVGKSEKTFKMSFGADFGRESEKTLTLE